MSAPASILCASESLNPMCAATRPGNVACSSRKVRPGAELRCLDLFGIAATHGGHGIGINDAAFQEIHVIVMLQTVHGEEVPTQSHARHGRFVELALVTVADVMDGQHGLYRTPGP